MNSTHENGIDPASALSPGTIVQILMCVVAIGIYGCGVFLHIKIIQVSKREKDMSWMLDVTNSTIFIVHFAHTIFMHGITYLVQNMYLYTGEWYCYLSKAVSMLGIFHSIQNSFVIALLKYVMIVHFQPPHGRRKEYTQYLFFALNLIYPFFVFGVFLLLMPDFIIRYDGISQANRCLGIPEVKIKDHVKIYNACTIINGPDEDTSSKYFFYLTRKITCWMHVGVTYLNSGNILEMLLYFRIFAFMHR